jgi:hypothetical protein
VKLSNVPAPARFLHLNLNIPSFALRLSPTEFEEGRDMDEQKKLHEIKKQLEQVAIEICKLNEIVQRLREELERQKNPQLENTS